MLKRSGLLRLMGSIAALSIVTLFVAACGGDDPTPTAAPTATSAATSAPAAPTATSAPVATEVPATVKEVIKFHDGQWGSLWVHNAIAMYVIENGYGYPTEEIQGTTGTAKLTLVEGDIDVNMELWRMNIGEWYEEATTSGAVLDLAGKTDPSILLSEGAKGQVIAFGGQGFYVPTYLAEANPGLKSVSDLPQYKDLFTDPNDPSKGAVMNCIIGWQCQKINRAKWFAYGLYDTYNVVEPGGGAALKAAIVGPYAAEEPFLSYYWEPTDVVNLRDLTLLEEPAWTSECQAALDAAVQEEPYESTMGCAFPSGDVHTGIHKSLKERAPEVTEFLANFYMGAGVLAEMEVWKADNDADWIDVAVEYLKKNRDIWTTWITDSNSAEIIAYMDKALAAE